MEKAEPINHIPQDWWLIAPTKDMKVALLLNSWFRTECILKGKENHHCLVRLEPAVGPLGPEFSALTTWPTTTPQTLVLHSPNDIVHIIIMILHHCLYPMRNYKLCDAITQILYLWFTSYLRYAALLCYYHNNKVSFMNGIVASFPGWHLMLLIFKATKTGYLLYIYTTWIIQLNTYANYSYLSCNSSS